jgi:hypothetical protein
MKTSLTKTKRNQGIALIIAVILVAFAALYFVTYLILTANEFKQVARSQTWNDSLTVAEAGVEEGLALVNKNAYDTQGVTNWWLTATSDGWTDLGTSIAGTNVFHTFTITRTLPSASGYSDSYTVYVTNVTTAALPYSLPTIYSIGTVQNESVPTVSRQILVQTTAVSIGAGGGVISQAGIKNNGTVLVDSWDSSTNIHSIWQPNSSYRFNYFSPGIKYGLWSNSLSFISNSYPSRTANVYVFTDQNVIQLVGGITIAGYLQTGPNGTASIGSQASVGDMTWCFGPGGGGPGTGTTGLQPGHWQQDANRNFSSYPLPAFQNTWQSNRWLPIPHPVPPAPGLTNVIKIGGVWWYTNNIWTNIGGAFYTNYGSGFTINGNSYDYVITNRLQNTNWVYYAADQLNASVFVDAQYVALYLTNGWSYSGSSQVFTLNTNADITVYSTGDIKATGNAVINNLGNYTHAFNIYDVKGNPVNGINVELGGNAMATGNYYLPSSTFKFDGGGSSGDFVGSIFCYYIDDHGHVNIHFDQSINNQPPPDQFIATSWTEIAPDSP